VRYTSFGMGDSTVILAINGCAISQVFFLPMKN
jgi:hypothetical protein